MSRNPIKILSLLLCLFLIFQQSGFAQIAGQLDISGHLDSLHNAFTPDVFRPLHLRYLSYDAQENNFRIFLDKGNLKNPAKQELEDTSKTLLKYFFIGLTLPNDTFWVNLRPDAEDNIIDPALAQTDVGKILLESDLQLKKDTAKFTSPETPEGREYWDKLYRKAGEIFGSQNITIPTLTRPWIVPDEIIIRETPDSAYIYKATLKVMLEQDYLKDSTVYNFKDERLKELNEYSSQLIRELIIPKLTKEVNSSKRYASLRQVYYSLIMAQWFKARFYDKNNPYSHLIDRKNLTNLISKESWSKTTYFKEYQKSFKDGEYNIQEPVYSLYGQTIRSYFSGGISGIAPSIPTFGAGTFTDPKTGANITSSPAGRGILDIFRKGKKFLVLLSVSALIGINSDHPVGFQVTVQETTPTGIAISLDSKVDEINQIEAEKIPSSIVSEEAIAYKVVWELLNLPRTINDKIITIRNADSLMFWEDAFGSDESSARRALKLFREHRKKVMAQLVNGRTIDDEQLTRKIRNSIIEEQKGIIEGRSKGVIKIDETYSIFSKETYVSAATNKKIEVFIVDILDTFKGFQEGVYGNRAYPDKIVIIKNNVDRMVDKIIAPALLGSNNIPAWVGYYDYGKAMALNSSSAEIIRKTFRGIWSRQKIFEAVLNSIRLHELQHAIKWDHYHKNLWDQSNKKADELDAYLSALEGDTPQISLIRMLNDLVSSIGEHREALGIIFKELCGMHIQPEKRIEGDDLEKLAKFFLEFSKKDATQMKDYLHNFASVIREKYPVDSQKGGNSSGFSGIDDSTSSPLSSQAIPQTDNELGGIDFRNLPIVTQAIGNLSANIGSSSINRLSSINLDSEWRDIENLVNSGIIPSAERIKEYVQASCYKGNADRDIDKVISCISDILRLEEEWYSKTEPILKDILVVLESVSSIQQLRATFIGTTP